MAVGAEGGFLKVLGMDTVSLSSKQHSSNSKRPLLPPETLPGM